MISTATPGIKHKSFSFLIWEKGQQPGRCFPFCKGRSYNTEENLPPPSSSSRHPFDVFPPSYFISPSTHTVVCVCVSALISILSPDSRQPIIDHVFFFFLLLIGFLLFFYVFSVVAAAISTPETKGEEHRVSSRSSSQESSTTWPYHSPVRLDF